MDNKIKEYWDDFLEKTDRDKDTKLYEAFSFDLHEHIANSLLELVLSGKKTATASSLLYYQTTKEKLPEVGCLSIVTDWNGNPKCIIETTAVTIIPFKDITYDICKREGEDDNLESWQEGHIRFYQEDGLKTGYEFTWEMPVVFEDFKVIYK